jgi:CO/xanthine dehydrogenase Mo-binding subunit
VRIGATAEGKLVSLQHDYVYHRSMLDAHHEDSGEATAFQYSVPNLRVTFGRAKRNVGSTVDMRGPGAVPGLYATESAMNELAEQLKIDPVRLRVITTSPRSTRSWAFRSHRAICSSASSSARRSSGGPGARPGSAR